MFASSLVEHLLNMLAVNGDCASCPRLTKFISMYFVRNIGCHIPPWFLDNLTIAASSVMQGSGCECSRLIGKFKQGDLGNRLTDGAESQGKSMQWFDADPVIEAATGSGEANSPPFLNGSRRDR